MKTISVKQVAEALALTPRAVIYRLEKGQLKGTQSPNAFGKQEWRVYPTKEIIEGLKRFQGAGTQKEQVTEGLDFSPDEAVDVDSFEYESNDSKEGFEDSSWQEHARETLKNLAEELVRPLGETIRAQQDLLAEKEKMIEDKDRQLKLLPDLQRVAESERQAAELKSLELEALRRQIEALNSERAKEQEELLRLKEEHSAAEESRSELERLRLEQVSQAEAVEAQLAEVRIQLERLQSPWWKKWFTSPQEPLTKPSPPASGDTGL